MTTALNKGRAEGRAEGRDERTLEIAKNLKSMGISTSDIINATGRLAEDIEKI